MDRFAVLQAFVRVAETKSFSEAARRLHASKSVISRHVSGLEAELGVRLFHRTTRSLTLTEAGLAYFQQVSRILGDLDDADASVSALQSVPRGKLRISTPMSFGYLHLAQALPDFMARHPEIEIELSMSDRYVDLVEEGFDLALRLGRLGESSLIARKLFPIHMALCASPDYLARRGSPTHPDALRDHDCLCYSQDGGPETWRFRLTDGTDWNRDMTGRLRSNNGDALRVAALRGLGLCYLPTFIVGADLQAGSLVSVLDDVIPKQSAAYALYPSGRHLSPKVRAFVDFLVEWFGGTPYWDLVR